jgi:hypothetical protein
VPATRTDSAESEAASRQAVEAAWAKFWGVNTRLVAIPSSQIKQEIAAVAVDPTRGQMLSQISVFRSLQQGQYGNVINHPYWTRPIAGKTLNRRERWCSRWLTRSNSASLRTFACSPQLTSTCSTSSLART